jgi:hypothetical protein
MASPLRTFQRYRSRDSRSGRSALAEHFGLRPRALSAASFSGRTEFYLAHDAQNVWVVEPAEKWIALYAPGQSPRHFAAGQVLSSPLLPGFELSIDEFFAE